MSAAGFTPIQLYRSTTASAVPTSGNLADGELAINTNDGKLYYKDSGGAVQLIASKAGASGDVVGPASATDNAVVRFDNTTGKLVQNSVVTIADSTGDIAGAGSITSTSASGILTRAAATQDGVELIGRAGGSSSYKVTLTPTTLGGNRTLTLPDTTGTVALTGSTVASFSAGSTGFTPNSATTGAVTLAGTLATTNGGTGLTSFTANGVVYASSSSVLATGSALTFDGTNFGIGTSSPSFNLDIGNTSATSNFTQRIVSGASYAAMARYDLSGTGTFTVGFNNSGSVVNNAPSGAASLWMQQNYPLVFGINGSEQMRLTSTGLGIGTSSPGSFAGTVKTVIGGGTGNPVLTLYGGNATYSGIYFADGTTGNEQYRGFFEYNHANDSLLIGTSGATKATLDSSGNLGLGVTPSAWVGKAIEIGPAANGFLFNDSNNVNLGANAYYNAGWKYQTSSVGASRYAQTSGAHVWYNAASGTAGNAIPFTQAMTLDAGGNLLVGGTSSLYGVGGRGDVEINGSSTSILALTIAGSATNASYLYNTSTELEIAATGSRFMRFTTNGSERARITSGGDLLVGTTTSQDPLTVNGGATLNGGLDFSTSGTKNWQVVGNATDFYIGDQTLTRYAALAGITTFTAWTFVSDRRLKHEIKDIQYGLNSLMQIKPREFKFIKDDQFSIGFVAQELKQVIPEAVMGDEIEFDDNDSPEERASKTMGVSKEMLIPVLVKAIQEQQALITSLTARVALLEGN